MILIVRARKGRGSVVAFALIDVAPQIAPSETLERPWEFSVINQKGLFQTICQKRT